MLGWVGFWDRVNGGMVLKDHETMRNILVMAFECGWIVIFPRTQQVDGVEIPRRLGCLEASKCLKLECSGW